MTSIRFSVPAAVLVALAGCGPSAPVTPAAPEVTCNPADFDYLQGEPIDAVNTLSTSLRVRVLGPDDFVPRDYDPNRLTFTESPDGEVSRVFCG